MVRAVNALPHVDQRGQAHMVDVGAKPRTVRSATARGTVRCSAHAARLLRAGELAKGDAVAVARIAGIAAAKRTSDLIPLCHPVAITSVSVEIDVHVPADEDGLGVVDIAATVGAVDCTGVEMEALTAVSVAALAIFDMIKAVDRSAVISEIAVAAKSGGQSGDWSPPHGCLASENNRSQPRHEEDTQTSQIRMVAGTAQPHGTAQPQSTHDQLERAAVLTISDRCAAGERTDESGPYLVQELSAAGMAVVEHRVLPDDAAAITDALRREVAAGARLVVTTGGTGIAPRDVTPEATAAVLDRELPGVADAIRATGTGTPGALLSRGACGIAGRTLIVNLPGSLPAVRDGWGVLTSVWRHALDQLDGGDHPLVSAVSERRDD